MADKVAATMKTAVDITTATTDTTAATVTMNTKTTAIEEITILTARISVKTQNWNLTSM